MRIFENGNRVKQMSSICRTIVQVESVLSNTKNVKLEFLGEKVKGVEIKSLEQVESQLANMETVVSTLLGTALRNKILDDLVYKVASAEKPRPLLVSIITDGRVSE